MSYEQDFETVDLILESNTPTKGVDAFALSLIKCEKQIRRLLTHLVFQFPCFNSSDELRKCLSNNNNVYFSGFINGFDALYPRSIQELVGENHDHLINRLKEAIKYRNKIFHGQLTSDSLSFNDLNEYVTDIRLWCSTLANECLQEFAFDGFSRNSFQKSEHRDVFHRYKIQINNEGEYRAFIEKFLERKK